MRRSYIAILLLLVSCGGTRNKTENIYRGIENGLIIEKIVVTEYNAKGDPKDDRRISKYTYNRAKRQWDPLGGERIVPTANTNQELSNLRFYSGFAGDPPSASINIPQNIYLANNGGQNAIVVLTASSLNEIRRIPVPSFISAMGVSPDGLAVLFSTFVSGAAQLRQIDVLTNTVVRTLTLPTGSSVSGINYSPDGTRIYVSDQNLGVFVIDPQTLTISQSIARPTTISRIISSAISPDGDILIARAVGGAEMIILDLTTLTWTTATISGRATFSGDIPCVFHPNGTEFYCTTSDGIGVFNTATMSNVGTVTIPRGEIFTRLHSFEGGNYLILSSDKFVRLIDTATRTIESSLSPRAPDSQITTAFPVREF